MPPQGPRLARLGAQGFAIIMRNSGFRLLGPFTLLRSFYTARLFKREQQP